MTKHPNWDTLIKDDKQSWETLESRQLVSGFRVVYEDKVRLPSGVETIYQYRPRGPRAVFVFPVTTAGEAVLIRQYRYPLRATITEVVAGGVEHEEDILQAAMREMKEEVGAKTNDWIALPAFYPQPSISGVVFYPYLALNVSLGQMQHEATETIERLTLPLAEAYRRLEAGEILDGPSSLTMWHAKKYLKERGLLL